MSAQQKYRTVEDQKKSEKKNSERICEVSYCRH